MGSEPTPVTSFDASKRDWRAIWTWRASYLVPFALSVAVVVLGFLIDDVPGLVLGLVITALFWAHEIWCARQAQQADD
jgi:hypothetical protein